VINKLGICKWIFCNAIIGSFMIKDEKAYKTFIDRITRMAWSERNIMRSIVEIIIKRSKT
jgi:hypothetical protein